MSDVYSVCSSLCNYVRSLKASIIYIDRTQQLSYLVLFTVEPSFSIMKSSLSAAS